MAGLWRDFQEKVMRRPSEAEPDVTPEFQQFRVTDEDLGRNRVMAKQKERESWQPPPEVADLRNSIDRLITSEDEAGQASMFLYRYISANGAHPVTKERFKHHMSDLLYGLERMQCVPGKCSHVPQLRPQEIDELWLQLSNEGRLQQLRGAEAFRPFTKRLLLRMRSPFEKVETCSLESCQAIRDKLRYFQPLTSTPSPDQSQDAVGSTGTLRQRSGGKV